MDKHYILIRRWEAMKLQDEVNRLLKDGWELSGDTFVHQEERNHAVTGDPYKAPMFCQALIKELKS